MEVVLGFALIILWLAAPMLVAMLVVLAALGSVTLVADGVASRKRIVAVGGLALAGVAAVMGYAGLRYFTGPAVASPKLQVAEPRASWTGPLPQIFMTSDWDQVRPVRLLQTGAVRQVLGRRTSWEEIRVKPGPACEAAFSDDASFEAMARCVERVPISLAGGILDAPHFLQETISRHHPVRGEVTRFYLVDGTQKQLILSCEAEWPSERHPMAGFLVQRSREAISRQFNACKRTAFDGAMVAAIDRH